MLHEEKVSRASRAILNGSRESLNSKNGTIPFSRQSQTASETAAANGADLGYNTGGSHM